MWGRLHIHMCLQVHRVVTSKREFKLERRNLLLGPSSRLNQGCLSRRRDVGIISPYHVVQSRCRKFFQIFAFQIESRVAKCHEYDEYIHVKIFAGWGKKSGRGCNLAKLRLFGEDLHNNTRFLCIN